MSEEALAYQSQAGACKLAAVRVQVQMMLRATGPLAKNEYLSYVTQLAHASALDVVPQESRASSYEYSRRGSEDWHACSRQT